MERDPLDEIAEFTRRMQETKRYALQTLRLGRRLQAFAIVLVGLSLLGMGWLIWQHVGQTQALREDIRAHTARTQTLLEALRQGQTRP